MRPHRARRRSSLLVSWLLCLAALIVAACGPPPDEGGAGQDGVPTSPPADEVAPKLEFSLSEGTSPDPDGADDAPAAAVDAQPLDAARAAELLARLGDPPAIEDPTSPVFHDPALPPPRRADVVEVSFPAEGLDSDSAPPPQADPDAPLTVTRHAPEGLVPVAPRVSLTFSEPMVGVGQHAATADDVPASISPQPPGQWRWVGTKTLVFEPEGGRLPMSTRFEVEVPAGATAASGAKTAEALRFEIETPTLAFDNVLPANYMAIARQPVLALRFNQRVDTATVLDKLTLTADGKTYPIEQVDREVVEDDRFVQWLLQDAPDGFWIAVRPTEPLPRGASVELALQAGATSAEGPLPTPAPYTTGWMVHGDFEVVETRCGWEERGCTPNDSFEITFSNPIDLESFDKALITTDPPTPHLQVYPYEQGISLYGPWQGRTTYTVTIDRAMRDAFDQTLGEPATATFEVGDPMPTLTGPQWDIVVLDPSTGTDSSVFTVSSTGLTGLRVRVLEVEPTSANVQAFQQFRNDFLWGGMGDDARAMSEPPGTEVFSREIAVADAGSGTQVETDIDLTEVFGADGDPFGHAVVIVDTTDEIDPNVVWYKPALAHWVQRTDTSLTAISDPEGTLVWAARAADGETLSDVEVALSGEGGEVASARTGTDGLARLPVVDSGQYVLLARRDGDVAMLPWYGTGQQPERSLRWYVVDDRHMYRPGESMRVKGWVRHANALATGLGRLGDDAPRELSWRATDSYGNLIGEGKAALAGLDSFELEVDIPEQVTLGWAYLTLTLGTATDHEGYSYSHGFEIQAFRRPEFEVTSELLDAGPHFPEGELDIQLQASYYAGGALPDATVNWSVYATTGTYSPPGHERFSFGVWSPWWMSSYGGAWGTSQPEWKTYVGRTDSRGRHTLHVDLEGMTRPRPMVLTASGSVSDVNYQAWATTETVLVHPASVYVGLRTDKSFFEPDETFEVETIVADIDGAQVADVAVHIEASLLTWQRSDDGSWQMMPDGEPPQVCETTSRADAATRCELTLDAGGTWRLLARAQDPTGRPTETELRVWVAGGDLPPSRGLQAQTVTLVPESRSVAPGETARVLVQAPFVPAEGLVTVSRRGVLSHERIRLTEPTTTLELPVDDRWLGGVQLQVSLLGQSPRTGPDGKPDRDLPQAPAFAMGTLPIEVDTVSRRLTVEPTPRDAVLSPGGKTAIELVVTDHQGQPVSGAEVLVVVVDEAVLALSAHEMADPLEVFYEQVWPWFSQAFLHQRIVLDDPARLARGDTDADSLVDQVDSRLSRAEATATLSSAAPMGTTGEGRGAGGLAGDYFAANMPLEEKEKDALMQSADSEGLPAQGQARVRRNFDALALFAPDVVTDASGRASVPITLPDSLTRYRIIAVAADPSGQRFGKGEANLQARRELMVRPSAPRFLHVGDAARLPVVLQNGDDAPMTVDVAARHHGTAAALDPQVAGWRVEVPAGDRVEVFFPLTGLAAGGGHLEFVAATSDDRLLDAAEVILPVAAPSTIESHATYGEIDDGGDAIVQPIALPTVPVVDGVGALTVTTSSTALAELTDAMLYLVRYPFECSEQLASRLLAIASLRDVLAAFEAEGLPEPEALAEFVDRDLAVLEGRQNWDGGWGWWRQGQESSPYLTVHVVHALVRARDAGYTLQSPWVLDNALNYLRNIRSYIPSWVDERTRRAIIAYSLYTRALSGESVETEVVELIEEAGSVDEETMSLETVAWLMAVLPTSHDQHAVLRAHLGTHVSEEAGTALFVDGYSETGGSHILLHSNRRTDAVVLEALMRTEPKSDLVAKVVRGLLAHRTRGRWLNTQENAWVLVALGEYFDRVESETPDFVARVWLGPDVAGMRTFEGRSTTEEAIEVPLDWLRAHPDSHDAVAIRKDGDPGRLYYRIGMRWAPRAEALEPLERGFAVSRIYEAIDDEADVRQDDQGVWHVAAGARVRVRLTMDVPERRYHVALVDRLPAGFEAQNPELAVTGALPPDPNANPGGTAGWLWWGTWYEHQNLRDQQAEAFSQLVWEGTYEYTYVARATTPGTFIAPPPRVEEMYHPETFGRGASERIVVE